MAKQKFQSAVAHELFSDMLVAGLRAMREWEFQSAVAHELFSDQGEPIVPGRDAHLVSKRCRA